jgi:hypothetical protein
LQKELKKICKEKQKLKIIGENLLPKFRTFEYLKILQFDQKIISFHHFEMKNKDYIMINFETCYVDIFSYTNSTFIIAANTSNFGFVKHYITLNYEEKLYFLTIGKSACGRSRGNLWSFENMKIDV